MLNRLTKSAEMQTRVDEEYFNINMEGHQTRLKWENTLKNCYLVRNDVTGGNWRLSRPQGVSGAECEVQCVTGLCSNVRCLQTQTIKSSVSSDLVQSADSTQFTDHLTGLCL